MQQHPFFSVKRRLGLLNVVIIIICTIFFVRLFYLQITRYDYYQAQALGSQLKLYEIPAERGEIFAFDGGEQVPIVLNELRYQVVADPEMISDSEAVAATLAELLQADQQEIKDKLQRQSRYEILAKKQTKEVKAAIDARVADGSLPGVFTEKTVQRVYPHSNLAAQLIGFVNDEGVGNYGVEEALNDTLAGTAGRVRALTDQKGIPLLASGDNVQEDPIDGRNVVLTLDIAMQRQVERVLKEGLDAAKSDSGSALVLDPNSGAVKAMANWPTYDQARFQEVDTPEVYANAAVSAPLEPGSIMKALTTAAALDMGVVGVNDTFYDPGQIRIGDATVRNVEEVSGAATRPVSDIIRLSLNTGATYLLQQMGGGEINQTARETWYDYMVGHYQLGKATGIEQGYEEPGIIPNPTEGWGLDIQYANTSFGQGMTATPLQMGAALASIVNGGTYYKPTLVAGYIESDGSYNEKRPETVRTDVVSEEAGAAVRQFMQSVISYNSNVRAAARPGYIVGGKTGTAQIPKPEGGYYEDRFNGTFMGFVGGDRPEYVVVVRVNEPKIGGYAGSKAAGPIFVNIVTSLIDNFAVPAASGQ